MKIGVSFQAVSKWENDISLPDVATLPIIAGFFGVSMDTIFDYDAEKISEKRWKSQNKLGHYTKAILYLGKALFLKD